MKHLRNLTIGLLILGSLTIIPNAAALHYVEDFESDTTLQNPIDPFYTFSKSSINAFVATNYAHSGTKSLYASPTTALGVFQFDYATVPGCTSTTSTPADTPMWTFWLRLNTLPPSGTTDTIRVGASAFMGFSIHSDGSIYAATPNAGADAIDTGKDIAAATWTDFTIYSHCTELGGGSGQYSCVSSETLLIGFCSTPATASNGATTEPGFKFEIASASPFTRFINLDDISVRYGAQESNVFCSDPTLDRFGYNYAEDTTYFTDNDAGKSELQTGFVMSDKSNDDSYLAKAFSTGTTTMAVNFTIEAGTDTRDSTFRVAYSFVNPSSYIIGTGDAARLNGPNDAGADAKGNGETTELFASEVEIDFVENGNNWIARAWETTGGIHQQIGTFGGAATIGNANHLTSYQLYIDTRSGGEMILSDSDGQTIMSGLVANFAGSYTGSLIRSQWFIGHGDSTILNAQTYLNNNDGTAHSTCIYSTLGDIVVYGSQGTQDDTFTPPTITQTNTATSGAGGVLLAGSTSVLPDGWTVSAFNGFLGITLILCLAGGFYFLLDKTTIAGAIGAGAGLFLAYFLGLFGLWLIVVVTVLAAAFVFLKIRGMATGG